MADLLNRIVEIVQQVIQAGGYPGIALVMFLENVFPPIPSEVIMPFGGFLAAKGDFNFFLVWIAGTIGSVAGAVVLYYIGLFAGDVVIRRFLRRYGRWIGISEGDYDRSLGFFRKYGEWIVLFGRVIPLVRSLVSIPAGAERMPVAKFMIYTIIGSAVWSGALALAGYLLGDRWEEIIEFIEQYQDIVVVGLILLVVLFVAFIVYRRFTMKPEVDESHSA
jgi:membrane protein DedA with SNARE-associated domain